MKTRLEEIRDGLAESLFANRASLQEGLTVLVAFACDTAVLLGWPKEELMRLVEGTWDVRLPKNPWGPDNRH